MYIHTHTRKHSYTQRDQRNNYTEKVEFMIYSNIRLVLFETKKQGGRHSC